MQDTVPSILELGKYGTVGVMIALILLSAFTTYMNWKTSNNHIKHSTTAINKNTEALTKLIDIIDYKLKK